MFPDISILLLLLNNLSIFIVLFAGYGLLNGYLEKYRPVQRQIFLGIFFGLVAIGSMYVKIPVVEGVIVDQRNAIVALSGAFGGPVSAIFSAFIAASYRTYLGGVGVLSGAVGVCVAGLIGAVLFRFRKDTDGVLKYAVGSLIVVLCILPGFLLVGDLEYGWALLKRVALPFGMAIYIGLFFGSLVLAREDRRHSIEIENKRSEERYKNLFESSEISIWNEDFTDVYDWLQQLRQEGVTDLRQYFAENSHVPMELVRMIKIDDVNRATLRLYNAHSREEFENSITKVFTEETIKTVEDVFCAIWAGSKSFRAKTTQYTLDGEELEVILSMPIPDHREGFHSLPVSILDITEHKRAEDARDEALREAERANQAKSEFLATMSHELRTPLNAILGFSDILSQQYFGPLGAVKYEEYAKDIHSSGELLLELVNDLLDISTIEAGEKYLTLEPLEVSQIISDSVAIIEEKALLAGIHLSTDFPMDLQPMYADKRALRQILLNLLSNAVKFTPSGGAVTISATQDKKSTNIFVSDTGDGIPDEIMGDIINPFVRAESDPHKADKGWGLGLAIANSLIELHEGTLVIKSKVGEGTTIKVTFANYMEQSPDAQLNSG